MNHKLSFALLLIALIGLMSCSSKSQSKFTEMQENLKIPFESFKCKWLDFLCGLFCRIRYFFQAISYLL